MAWYTVDRRLITVKLFYFTSLSALASLMPYLGIFLTQLGFQETEIALVYSLIFFLSFLKNVLTGFLADRFKAHKLILILSCLVSGPLYCFMLLVPVKPGLTLNGECRYTPSEVFSNLVPITESEMTNSVYCDFTPLCPLTCRIINFTESAGNSNLASFTNANITTTTNSSDLVSCAYASSCTKPFTSLTFWLGLLLTVGAGMTTSNQILLNDSVAMRILGENRAAWGRSRLWGSVGYGMCSLGASLLIYFVGKTEETYIDYTPAFYVNLGLNLSGAVVAYFHPVGNDSPEAVAQEKKSGVRQLLHQPRVVVFLIMVFFLGIFNGFAITWLILYLRVALGASQICLCFVVIITVLVEIPTMFIGGAIVKKIGANVCLYLSFAAYGVRFLAFTFIDNPWWAILIESSHLFTFALMFTAATMHASEIVSPDSVATIIGLLNGVKWGLGLGTGSLIGGFIIKAFSYKLAFLGSSVSAFMLLIVFFLINKVILRYACPLPVLTTAANGETDFDLKQTGMEAEEELPMMNGHSNSEGH